MQNAMIWWLKGTPESLHIATFVFEINVANFSSKAFPEYANGTNYGDSEIASSD